MKLLNMLKVTAVALLISGVFTSNTMAASTTGTADALVVTPISITPNDPLNFAGFVAGTAGTVSISNAGGSSTSTGGIQLLDAATADNANFFVTGDPNRAYSATIDSSVTLSNGTDTMTAIPNFPSFFPPGSVLDASGNSIIFFGGTLTVLGTESTGAYTGTYNVFVDY